MKQTKNKNTRKSFILASILLITIFSSIIISAIGITPGRTTLNFKANLHKEISLSIINTENKDISLSIFVKGDLNNSITLNQTQLEFSKNESSKLLYYTINLPTTLSPGKHKAEIVVTEIMPESEEIGTSITTTSAIASQIHVYAPYPDKYVEATINIIESAERGKTYFLIPVINHGSINIRNINVTIDIYNQLNEKITTIYTNTKSLNITKREELYAEWQADVYPGEYKAIATINYDEKINQIERIFKVGKMIIGVNQINVMDFELGGIARFNILVENTWSDEIEEVYVQMQLFNNKNETIADFKSPTYNIPNLGRKEIISYWDTEGVEQGEYNGKLIIKYGNRKTERDINIKVTETAIEVTGFNKASTIKTHNIRKIPAITIILIIITIILIIIQNKKSKYLKNKRKNR